MYKMFTKDTKKITAVKEDKSKKKKRHEQRSSNYQDPFQDSKIDDATGVNSNLDKSKTNGAGGILRK